MDLALMKKVLPILLKGSLQTLELTITTIIIGSILGVILVLMKMSKASILKGIASIYIWVFRGTPLILQLFFFYYGLPSLNIKLTSKEAAIIGFGLNCGAYMAEIIRGGILSIEKGQFEAAKSLGFGYLPMMRRIIIPQTYRRLIPPVGNELIAILKDTSIVSTISMVELMRSSQQLYATTFKPIEIFATAGALYLLMTSIFTIMFNILEIKLGKYE